MIASIMSEEMDKILLGDVTIAEGLDTLKQRADEAIREAIAA
jgi:hypothetical protein